MKKSYILETTPKENKEIGKFIWKTTRKMNMLWGSKFPEPPFIFLIKSRRDFDKINGRKTEFWYLAWASNSNFIFLLDPKVWEEQTSHNKKDFGKIMHHEFFHIYQQRIAGSATPQWLAEGAACYFSSQPKKPASDKDLLSIFNKEISGNKYDIGYFWAKLLAKRFGEKKLIGFLKRHRRTFTPVQFTALWKEVFGVPFSKKWGEAEIEKWRKNG